MMIKQPWFIGLSLSWFVMIVLVHYFIDVPVSTYMYLTVAPHASLATWMHWGSNFGYGWPYLVGFALMAGLGYLMRRRQLMWGAIYLWLCVAISGLLCDILKLFFGRPRPPMLFEHHLSHFVFWGHHAYHLNNYMSFPSGHATTAAAVAMGLWLCLPRLRGFSVVMLAVVMVARVVLLRHYVADVMAGAYLGAVTAIWLYARMRVTTLVMPAGRMPSAS